MRTVLRAFLLALAAILLLASTAAAATLRGAWTATPAHDTRSIQLSMNRDGSNWGMPFDLAAFTGLSESQIAATSDTAVRFSMQREAGTVDFEGMFRGGNGAGLFTFTPNASFFAAIRAMGIRDDLDEDRSEDEKLFSMAVLDVSTSYIRAMKAKGYDVSLREYQRMRIFGVTPALVDEYRALGFASLDSAGLVRMRIHGATPQYIRELRSSGFPNLSADEIVRTRIHGATPEFARRMAAAGYPNLPLERLLQFRIHGVTPEFVAALRELGYTNVAADDLVRMRIHGVSPEFIREIAAAGYHDVPVEKLVRMRIQGIDGKFLKAVGK